MFKFIKKSSFILMFLFGSFAVNANLIPLTSNDYITVDHGNKNLIDWAWASSVNVQFDGDFTYDDLGNIQLEFEGAYIYDSFGKFIDNPTVGKTISPTTYNELYAPDHIEGWRVATEDEFTFFQLNIGISDFRDEKNNLIHATSFWNSLYTDGGDISIDAFESEASIFNGTGYKTSSWAEGSFFDFSAPDITGDISWYDTFYVRTHSSDLTPVPEPSTLMIFALGLIALASKKKAFLKSTK